jgi:transposase
LSTKAPGEKVVRDIRRKTRKQYSAEEKVRTILDGLLGEESVAAFLMWGGNYGHWHGVEIGDFLTLGAKGCPGHRWDLDP